MQRQSLGSPALKHHFHGVKDEPLVSDSPKRKSPRSSSTSSSFCNAEDHKLTKPRRFSLSPASSFSSSSSPNPEKLIHLIPVFTLFCFLILYLVSHNPSQSDLAQFKGLKSVAAAKHIDTSAETESVGRVVDLQKGGILRIGSLRNLQESDKPSLKSRPPRKIAGF